MCCWTLDAPQRKVPFLCVRKPSYAIWIIDLPQLAHDAPTHVELVARAVRLDLVVFFGRGERGEVVVRAIG